MKLRVLAGILSLCAPLCSIMAQVSPPLPGAGSIRPAPIGVMAMPVPEDSSWSDQFVLPGTNGEITAMVVSGPELYIGGRFTMVDGVPAKNIARWNGSTWSAIGGGMDIPPYSAVSALAVSGSDVYVGGNFPTVNDDTVNNIAHWDGVSWSALGGGVEGDVLTIALSGTDVYAGGYLYAAGGNPVNRIARWNGTSWDDVGGGVVSTWSWGWVMTLAVRGADLFVGGDFNEAGGSPANYIARWDGAAWSNVGSPVGANDLVAAIAADSANVYAAGRFTSIDGTSANRVARWDGSSWSALGAGADGTVTTVAVNGSSVAIAGYFATAGGVTATNIAIWSGGAWSEPGGGMGGVGGISEIKTLAVQNGEFYAGGSYGSMGTVGVGGLARWNGSAWSGVGSGRPRQGIKGAVRSITAVGGKPLVGGNFFPAGTTHATAVAMWEDTAWGALQNSPTTGIGAVSTVYAVTTYGGNVTVGGAALDIYTPPMHTMANMAQWDGASWAPYPSDRPNDNVFALANVGPDLYVGGQFWMIGASPIGGIGRWNGSSWSQLGTGVDHPWGAIVRDIAVSGTDLIVAGRFATAGGIATGSVAKWNGSSWSAVGSGLAVDPDLDIINAVVVHGGDVYIAGEFTAYGSITRWNGASWSSVGGGVGSGYVLDLCVLGGELYAGGDFDTIGGVPAHNIAKWNGSTWEAIGSGIDDVVYALGPVLNDLYAGGMFNHAGAKPSSGIARWTVAPLITSAFPAGGSVGSVIEIHGGRFDTAALNNTVLFGAVGAQVLAASETTLTVVVPPGAVSAPVSVTSFGRSRVSGFNFTITAPIFTTPTPAFTFGSVSLTYTRIDTLHIQNTGPGDLIITDIHVDSALFSISPHVEVVPGLSSRSFVVTFSPLQLGFRSSIVVFFSNAATSPDTVILDGTGVLSAFVVEPAVLHMGPAGNGSVDSVVVISEVAYPLIISSAIAGYPFLLHPAADTLQTGDSSVFYVTLQASEPGPHTASLVFTHNVPGSPDTVTVTATAMTDTSPFTAPRRWTLASNPFGVPNDSVRVLTGGAASQAYGFSPGGGYQPDGRLRHGRGYWVSLPPPGNLTLSGVPFVLDSVQVSAGWNLVGSIASPVPVTDISGASPGLATSRYYGYDGSYSPADTIQPGRAYWVKAYQSGTLILTAAPGPSAAGRTRIIPSDDEPPVPPGEGATASAGRELPTDFGLDQNYPNPFNPATTIAFRLPAASSVTVTVFNAAGQEVARLLDAVPLEAGRFEIRFEAAELASGVYFCRMTAARTGTSPRDRFTAGMKMLILK